MSDDSASLLTVDDRGVATFRFDDPDTHNALSVGVLAELDRDLAELAQNTSIRVIVFTGAGTTFSSGADRSELGDPETIERTTALLTSILSRIEESTAPVVCRVNGAAFGAGLAIVAAADISISLPAAVFGLPEVRFGLVPGPAAAACMSRIGQAAALDAMLTGRRFDAAEAERMHLLTAVVEPDDLDAAVESRLADILLGDCAAIASTRRLVRAMSAVPLTLRLDLVRRASAETSNDSVTYGHRELPTG